MSSTFRFLIVASLLACAQAPALALTVGQLQGMAQLGQPLELQVPVGLDPGLSTADLCPQATARYGDRSAPVRLDVRAEPLGEGVARLHLRTQQTVDEPFVVIELSAGCSQRLTRRFVVLADAPLPARSASPASPASPLPTEPAARSDNPAPEARAVVIASSAEPAPGASIAPVPATNPSPATKPAPAITPSPRPSPAASGVARATPISVSASSGAIALAPGSADPIPGADSERLQALEGQVLALQASLQSSQVAAAELRNRLQATEQRQETVPWVEAALAAAVTGWGLSGLAWWRARRSQRRPVSRKHWADRSSPPAPPAVAGAAPATDAQPGQEPRMQDPWALRSQEVSDVRQEADFFVSLGEEDRAIDLLRAHLQSDEQASPQTWLHLLRLLYRLGRQDDYQQARAEFERWAETRPAVAPERPQTQTQADASPHRLASGANTSRVLTAAQSGGGAGAPLDIDLDRVLGQVVPARELNPLADVPIEPDELTEDRTDRLSVGPAVRRG